MKRVVFSILLAAAVGAAVWRGSARKPSASNEKRPARAGDAVLESFPHSSSDSGKESDAFAENASSAAHQGRRCTTTEAALEYWTSPGIEPDTCVAAWLLTRFVSPGARVVVAESSDGGTAFDIADCPLSRRPGAATSDVIVETFHINDPLAVAVTAIVHELELNPWTLNDSALFVRVREGLAEAVNAEASDPERLERAMRFLDELRSKGVGVGTPANP